MANEKIKLKYPVIVEGRYDKSTLLSVFDTVVITTGGFGIFNSEEKKSLIRKIAKNGIIILCDSDGGGTQIRAYLHAILGKDSVYDAYIPNVKGKESRKARPSKAGTLGVEGMNPEQLKRALAPFIVGDAEDKTPEKERKMITKVDFYLDGLSGGANSKERRTEILKKLDLPTDMSAAAMLEALNLLISYEEYKSLIEPAN